VDSYLKGQGQAGCLKLRVHIFVSVL